MKCRHCDTELTLSFIDLGSAPPSNAYLTLSSLSTPEKHYPLQVLLCKQCWLVQTEDYANASELFAADYAYFSSFSSSWLSHAEHYVTRMVERFALTDNSYIIEVAANKPDYVQILPWNLRTEITDQLAYIREWGGQFVTTVPKLVIE